MPRHYSEDYKISAIEHYLYKTNNLTKTCKEIECSQISLRRWSNKYNDSDEIKRSDRKFISYKVTKDHVKYAVKMLKENEQITMTELSKIIKNIRILILHHNI